MIKNQILILLILLLSIDANSQNCLSGDCKNGFGKSEIVNGIYEGYWKDGQSEGIGSIEYTNGMTIFGGFHLNKIHGLGHQIIAEKENFFGYFKEGKREGIGTLYKAYGIVRTGIWHNNKLNDSNQINPKTLLYDFNQQEFERAVIQLAKLTEQEQDSIGKGNFNEKFKFFNKWDISSLGYSCRIKFPKINNNNTIQTIEALRLAKAL